MSWSRPTDRPCRRSDGCAQCNSAVAARAEAGDIHLVTAPWNNDFLDEAEIFPDGPHDDQIDALAGAYNAHTRHRDIGNLPGCDPQDLRKDSHWTTLEI